LAHRTAAYVDYQQRASEFVVGDLVFPYEAGNSELAGRVMAVYPAIGMVDVEWPHGSQRMPVEDLQRVREDHQHNEPAAVGHDNIPGGSTVGVPGGPVSLAEGELLKKLDDAPGLNKAATRRVAEAFVKKALYWASSDRQYRATAEECASNHYTCPRCRAAALKKAVYKRRGGASDKLFACPECTFLIKREDIIGHPEYVASEGRF
jgi:hypothetical protein